MEERYLSDDDTKEDLIYLGEAENADYQNKTSSPNSLWFIASLIGLVAALLSATITYYVLRDNGDNNNHNSNASLSADVSSCDSIIDQAKRDKENLKKLLAEAKSKTDNSTNSEQYLSQAKTGGLILPLASGTDQLFIDTERRISALLPTTVSFGAYDCLVDEQGSVKMREGRVPFILVPDWANEQLFLTIDYHFEVNEVDGRTVCNKINHDLSALSDESLTISKLIIKSLFDVKTEEMALDLIKEKFGEGCTLSNRQIAQGTDEQSKLITYYINSDELVDNQSCLLTGMFKVLYFKKSELVLIVPQPTEPIFGMETFSVADSFIAL